MKYRKKEGKSCVACLHCAERKLTGYIWGLLPCPHLFLLKAVACSLCPVQTRCIISFCNLLLPCYDLNIELWPLHHDTPACWTTWSLFADFMEHLPGGASLEEVSHWYAWLEVYSPPLFLVKAWLPFPLKDEEARSPYYVFMLPLASSPGGTSLNLVPN